MPNHTEENRERTEATNREAPPTVGALEVSTRWLAICPEEDGVIMRYGPFRSEAEAQEYISERFDFEAEIVEMHDVDLLEAAMSAWLLQRDYERSFPAVNVTATITVNGVEHLVEGKTIAYEQIAILAKSPGSKELTMTYRGKGDVGGSMIPGERIPLRDGLHFCAVVTGNA